MSLHLPDTNLHTDHNDNDLLENAWESNTFSSQNESRYNHAINDSLSIPNSPNTSTRSPSFFSKFANKFVGSKPKDKNASKEPSYFTLPRKGQILILVICRLIEPLMYTSIAPYLYYMVEDFGYTDPSTISSICSVIVAIFALGQALTGVVWGSLSDVYGRKPILICGIIGTSISTVMFGFSKSLFMACASRFLAGVLNGNVGVMRTMIAEMVADHKEYQTRAFAVMPMTFNIGTIMGPVIGGLLADPAKNYPNQFWAKLPIFKQYPYLLPNAFPMPLVLVSLVICYFFLEETLEDDGDPVESKILMPKDSDYGLKLGRMLKSWIKTKFKKTTQNTEYTRVPYEENDDISLHEGAFEEYNPTETDSDDDQSKDAIDDESEENSRQDDASELFTETAEEGSAKTLPASTDSTSPDGDKENISIREVLTKPVRVTIACYTILMTHCPSFLQLLPLFMATPRLSNGNPKSTHTFFHKDYLPFIFNGGLGMPSARIGTAMAIMGVVGISLQFLVYPRVAAWLGNARVHRCSLVVFPIAYVIVPFIGLITRNGYNEKLHNGGGGSGEETAGMDYRWSTTFSVVPVALLVIFGRTFAIPPMPVLITNAASSRKVLGKVHGLTSSVTSVARCLGPFLLGNLYSAGVKLGIIGLAWWIMALLVIYEIYIARELKEWGSEEEDEEQQIRLN